ncbi:MAG: hypothetical protein IJ640_07570 [Prevotella sp.]|nr:hypothetical protein [Prevotella sp.]
MSTDCDLLKELRKKRRANKEGIRMDFAIKQLTELGYKVTMEQNHAISIIFKGERVMVYPYTGWFTGKTVKDSRGIKNLLKQIKQ